MQKAIEQITGISADERSEMIYENGLAYLRHQCLGYEGVADEISASRTFWRWWAEHWNRRDEAFAAPLNPTEEGKHGARVIGMRGLKKQTARQLYEMVHNPIALSCELNMNAHVLQESYASMMGKLNDECVGVNS